MPRFEWVAVSKVPYGWPLHYRTIVARDRFELSISKSWAWRVSKLLYLAIGQGIGYCNAGCIIITSSFGWSEPTLHHKIYVIGNIKSKRFQYFDTGSVIPFLFCQTICHLYEVLSAFGQPVLIRQGRFCFRFWLPLHRIPPFTLWWLCTLLSGSLMQFTVLLPRSERFPRIPLDLWPLRILH